MSEQYRQGDVILIRVDKSSVDGLSVTHRKRGEGIILAAGEATGHHHRVRDSHARLFEGFSGRFLRVPKSGATLTHEEHDPIQLPEGTYLIGGQREYTPPALRRAASTQRVWD